MRVSSPEGALSGHPDHPIHIAPVPRISIQAFCETSEMAGLVNDATLDRRMARAHVKTHMGGAAAAAEAYRNAPTPNLIIIESKAERANLIGFLESLAESCDAGTRVVIIGYVNDIVLYRELMARGISDYMVVPVTVLDLVQAVSRLYSDPTAAPVGRVIAVAGAKGGCGSSTVAHNLGWAISKQLDLATVIVDLDLPFGTAGLNFNQDPPQSIADAVFSPDRLDGNLIDRLLSKCTDKLSLLTAPATLDQTFDFDADSFDTVLDLLRASIPCVVLDVPHQWTKWTKRLIVGADEVVLVASPDLANLRNTKNMLDILKTARPHDAVPKFVMNGIGLLKRPEISISDFSKAIEIAPLITIPFDAKLFGTAANNGQMIGEVDAGSKITESFVKLAQRVSGRQEGRSVRKSLLGPFMTKLARKRAS